MGSDGMFVEDRQLYPNVGAVKVVMDATTDVEKRLFRAKTDCIVAVIVAKCTENWEGMFPVSVGVQSNKNMYVDGADVPNDISDSPIVSSIWEIVEKGGEIWAYANNITGVIEDEGDVSLGDIDSIIDPVVANGGKIEFTVVYIRIEDFNK